MRFKSRVAHLEKQASPNGACPECGFRPDDFRTIYIGTSRPRPDGSVPPLVEIVNGDEPGLPPNPPGRERCGLCGGWAKIEFIDERQEPEEQTL
jgi:hypothetical protein